MARSFSKKEACLLSNEHNALMNDLRGIINTREELRRAVVSSADAILNKEVEGILAGIPVDELNRDGAGLRIKNLKDAGFNTIADVMSATKTRLANVNGISPEGAGVIKNISLKYAN